MSKFVQPTNRLKIPLCLFAQRADSGGHGYIPYFLFVCMYFNILSILVKEIFFLFRSLLSCFRQVLDTMPFLYFVIFVQLFLYFIISFISYLFYYFILLNFYNVERREIIVLVKFYFSCTTISCSREQKAISPIFMPFVFSELPNLI